MQRFLVVFAAVASLVAHVARLDAQAPQPAPPSPVFEVASVKPNKSGSASVSFRLQPGGRFNALNVTVRDLIRFAYVVQPFQIEGGPRWLHSDRFDVIAKVEGEIVPIPPGQLGPVQLMAQNLLADRFKLKVHRETKDAPAYALVLARADRQLGKQIEPSTVDCAALLRAGRGAPPQAQQPGGRPPCRLSGGLGSIVGRDVSIGQLAQLLSGQLQRLVVDKTGLTGGYSLDLEFMPDQMPPPGAVPPGVQAPVIDPDRPSLFTALQEQLGLKLESQRAPQAMLIIDAVEQPTAD